MSYDRFFADAIAQLRDERRYRVFADLERIAGRFPHVEARRHHSRGGSWARGVYPGGRVKGEVEHIHD